MGLAGAGDKICEIHRTNGGTEHVVLRIRARRPQYLSRVRIRELMPEYSDPGYNEESYETHIIRQKMHHESRMVYLVYNYNTAPHLLLLKSSTRPSLAMVLHRYYPPLSYL